VGGGGPRGIAAGGGGMSSCRKACKRGCGGCGGRADPGAGNGGCG